jgi:phage tail tape-measure protein
MNLGHIVDDWGIYFDPDPKKTIIEEDHELIDYELMMRELKDDQENNEAELTKWVLRFAISSDFAKVKFDDEFEFKRDVA